MEQQPFYFELEDQLKMFLCAIDGCIVKRYNKNRTSESEINVRYVYASKQRALHDLLNKAQHITLPVVSYWIQGISYDSKREFNTIEGSNQVLNGKSGYLPQPIPIKIDLNVSFLAKYQTDIDQIVSNLVVYFRPYIAISWERFNLPWLEIRNKVIWSGNVSLTYPVDINENQPTRVTGDTTFTIEGWLFKTDNTSSGEIRNIIANFSALSSITDDIIFLNSQVNTDNTESFTISGYPVIDIASPYYINTDTNNPVNIYGTFLRGISSAYVSGNTVYDSLSYVLVDYFNDQRTLSADNPPFYGIPVDFTINSDNCITIDIPVALSAGNIDVIFLNKVGYSKLTDSPAMSSGITVY